MEQVYDKMERKIKKDIISFNDKVRDEILDKNIFKRFLNKDRISKYDILEDIDFATNEIK